MSDLRKNSYEDDDLRDVVVDIEELEAEILSISARAMGECAGVRKKIKNIKKRAKDDLAIPPSILTATLKTRKLERDLQKVAEDVPDDLAEVWVDAIGQFSLFATKGAEKVAPAAAAAAKREDAAKANAEAEQAEGAAVLDEISGEKVH